MADYKKKFLCISEFSLSSFFFPSHETFFGLKHIDIISKVIRKANGYIFSLSFPTSTTHMNCGNNVMCKDFAGIFK